MKFLFRRPHAEPPVDYLLETMTIDELINYNVELQEQINELREQKAAVIAVCNRKVKDQDRAARIERAGLDDEDIAHIRTGDVNVSPGPAHLGLRRN